MAATVLQSQIRRLLKKGSLSGFQIAQIACYEMWEGEHARDSILSAAEHDAIQRGLKNPADIREYNNWIRAFPSILLLTKDAEIVAQTAMLSMLEMGDYLRRYIFESLANQETNEELQGCNLPSPPPEKTWQRRGITLRDHIKDTLSVIKVNLEHFYFCKSVLEALSEKTGVNFCEDLEKQERRIELTLAKTDDVVAAAIHFSGKMQEAYKGLEQTIEIANLKPSTELENAFKKRLDEPLAGYQWYLDCKDLWLKEHFKQMPREEIEEMWLSNPSLGNEAKNKIRSLLVDVA